MSVEQMCRNLLDKAMDDDLIPRDFDEEGHEVTTPQDLSAGDLCGMANMLLDMIKVKDWEQSTKYNAIHQMREMLDLMENQTRAIKFQASMLQEIKATLRVNSQPDKVLHDLGCRYKEKLSVHSNMMAFFKVMLDKIDEQRTQIAQISEELTSTRDAD